MSSKEVGPLKYFMLIKISTMKKFANKTLKFIEKICRVLLSYVECSFTFIQIIVTLGRAYLQIIIMSNINEKS